MILAVQARVIDWDSPASWNAEADVTAVEELCRTGRTEAPVYDIAAWSTAPSAWLPRPVPAGGVRPLTGRVAARPSGRPHRHR